MSNAGADGWMKDDEVANKVSGKGGKKGKSEFVSFLSVGIHHFHGILHVGNLGC